MQPAALAAEHVSKRFGATRALDDVSFSANAGEIHALVGENGAGKSTLIRILGGVYQPDDGVITLRGERRQLASPREALAAGIVTIPQELRLVPALSVAENIALGAWPVRRTFGIRRIDRARMRADAGATLAQFDFAPDLDAPVRRLSFAERQLVAIGRALHRRCQILILDEPTAALEKREIDRLFEVLGRLKQTGVAIIYISHRLEEIIAISDRCTVMRDGRVVDSGQRGAYDVPHLIAAMTGGATTMVAKEPPRRGELLIDEPSRPDAVQLRAGEVIGLAGLLGSGTSNVLRRLFGAGAQAAEVRVNGTPRRFKQPGDAIAAGIGMVPGERRLGLVMSLSIRDNILLPSLDQLRRGPGIDRAAGDRLVARLMEELDIRPRLPWLRVSALSGGNQQKVIFAKWLARNVGVLLLDDATLGVDVAAKAQIHRMVRDFARRGGGVLASSSDLDELLHVCDEILALKAGAVVERLDATEQNAARLRAAIGGGP